MEVTSDFTTFNVGWNVFRSEQGLTIESVAIGGASSDPRIRQVSGTAVAFLRVALAWVHYAGRGGTA